MDYWYFRWYNPGFRTIPRVVKRRVSGLNRRRKDTIAIKDSSTVENPAELLSPGKIVGLLPCFIRGKLYSRKLISIYDFVVRLWHVWVCVMFPIGFTTLYVIRNCVFSPDLVTRSHTLQQSQILFTPLRSYRVMDFLLSSTATLKIRISSAILIAR